MLPYQRVVAGPLPDGVEGLLASLAERFEITGSPAAPDPARHEFGLYAGGRWRLLTARPDTIDDADPIARLDVAVLQDRVLRPLLGIDDPRTDPRIAFIGGSRGTGELERLVDDGTFAVAFALHPTSPAEVMAVADGGLVMPPKSTWFDPKLVSGLFVHRLGSGSPARHPGSGSTRRAAPPMTGGAAVAGDRSRHEGAAMSGSMRLDVPGAALVHVGRQPILDAMGRLYGYELLFRGTAAATSANTAETGERGRRGDDGTILSAFSEFGSQLLAGRLGFVNLTRAFIVGELPVPFPPSTGVLEVLETIEIDDEVIAGAAERVAEGHRLALDDFVWHERSSPCCHSPTSSRSTSWR